MENKKKPSELYFVPGHHDFNQDGTLFRDEMINWPIFTLYGEREISDNRAREIYRSAFQALTMIGPFKAKVSMGVNIEEKKLLMARRTWGQIYLNDIHVLSFSHDTRLDNFAFDSLLEWTEINPMRQGEFDKEWDDVYETLCRWTIDQWVYFFTQRIKTRSQFLLTKSFNMKKEAMEFEESAMKVLFAIL